MPQGAAGAPAWFISVIRRITTDLDYIRVYMDDVIVYDDTPIDHVANLATLIARLHAHKVKLSREEYKLGVARVAFLGDVILRWRST